jgi:trehalose 6-phosphate synthase/phosphatase
MSVNIDVGSSVSQLAFQLAQEPSLAVLLDYDGTLVPIASAPELAAPGPDVRALIARLAARARTRVHIVTGRPRHTVERWFGELEVELWAEHGFWHRPRPGCEWEAAAPVPPHWADRVYPIIQRFTSNTPGSIVEMKSASIAWHYRNAGSTLGPAQASALREQLAETLRDQPLEVLEGKKVIEVRQRGISKALVAEGVAASGLGQSILAIGDDLTDEDMFAALPPSSVTIVVGSGPSRARYRLADDAAVREFIAAICDRSESATKA